MRRNLPSLNALRAFEAYARHRRLVTAADELCVTHGAVSRQIKKLEQDLGVRLLTRRAEPSRLTKAGERYAGALHRLFDELERATPRRPARQARRLELLCPGAFSMKWLLPRLSRFSDARPDIRLEVVDSSGPWRPVAGGPQCAIRLATYEGASEAEVEAAMFMPRFHGPALSPALTAGGPLAPDELLRLPRLFTSSLPREWREWAWETGRNLPAPDREIGFDRSFHMLEAAATGLGVAMADWAMILPELEDGRLIAPLGFVRSRAGYVLLSPRGRRTRTWRR